MSEVLTGKIKRRYMAHYINAAITGTAAFVRLEIGRAHV